MKGKNVNMGVCSDRKERRKEGRAGGEKWTVFFFSSSSSFTLCVLRLKAGRSFGRQWSKVHVLGSLCQA